MVMVDHSRYNMVLVRCFAIDYIRGLRRKMTLSVVMFFERFGHLLLIQEVLLAMSI